MPLKKYIPLLLLVLCLSGCTAKTYTPVFNTEFDATAVYETGDYSYSCRIVNNGDYLSVMPTSTYAAGMEIKFDGKTVTYSKDGMVKSFDRERIDSTNPAILLYEVFSSIESEEDLKAEMNGDFFQYTGKTSVGNFILLQNKNNSLASVSIPDADIKITFDN